MAGEKDLSTAESLRKTRTYGQVRCHNPSCMGRLEPKPGEKTVKCPTCGIGISRCLGQRGFSPHQGPGMGCKQKLAEEALEER